MSRGNPNWTRKYGEATKVVRLPASLADEIIQRLKAEAPVDDIVRELAPYSTKLTIVQAIAQVMRMSEKPLTVKEIYSRILQNKLYEFRAEDPIQVVRGQLRRHCEGLEFKSALPDKHFVLVNSKYWLREIPESATTEEETQLRASRADLIETFSSKYKHYLDNLKKAILSRIKKLSPQEFELFSREFLRTIGFQNIRITEKYEDGSLKGYGDREMQFAFQVHRADSQIQPSDVYEFRGSIDGEFRQGMFFTTSGFAEKAIEASEKPGAIPIIPVDGFSIVEQMIDKKLEIEKEEIIKEIRSIINTPEEEAEEVPSIIAKLL